MKPLQEWPAAQRRQIIGVFTDIDDTLTTDGAITPDALQALHELKAAGTDPERAHEEVGDLLMAVANVARLLGTDPESALKAANRKFRRRFRHVEARLRESGRGPAESTLEEMDGLWSEAKAAERGA